VPYTSSPGTPLLTAEVPAAATAQGSVLSFQFVNPGNTLSNTFHVSTVRGAYFGGSVAFELVIPLADAEAP